MSSSTPASSSISSDGAALKLSQTVSHLNDRLRLYGVNVNVESQLQSSKTLVSSATRNRKLVASQSFPVGSIILQSTPYSFTLAPIPSASASAAGKGNGNGTDADDQVGPRHKCEWCNKCAGDVFRNSTVIVEKLLRCSACHVSQYCSSACQKSAWKAFHSFECKKLWTVQAKMAILERLAPEAKLDLILLGRCVRMRQKESLLNESDRVKDSNSHLSKERAGAPLRTSLEDLNGLESHYKYVHDVVDGSSSSTITPDGKSEGQLKPEVVLSMAQRLTDNTQLLAIGFQLGIFGPEVAPSHVQTLLLPLLTAFQSNNFAISNSLLLTVGAGVYPIGALLNHSCEPNCVIVYEERTKGEMRDKRGAELNGSDPVSSPLSTSGDVYPESYAHIQSIRTIRPVSAGEELTHSYIDTAATTAKRRRQLMDRYYFHCECVRCIREESGDVEGSVETFLERDCDGNQLPEQILDYQPEMETKDKGGKDTSSVLPPARASELLKANQLWQQATDIHLAPNNASTAAAYESEEQRRNELEQTLISHSLSLRLTHLHPYNVQLVSSYSKLLHICLLNGDYHRALHACEMLCHKYRVLYGDTDARKVMMVNWKKRQEQDKQLEIRFQQQLKVQQKQQRPPNNPLDIDSLAAAVSSDRDLVDSDDDLPSIGSYAHLPLHPLLGLQLYTLASLYGQVNDDSLALATYHASLRILRVTHGSTHPLVKRLAQEVEEFQNTHRSALAKLD